MKRIFSRKRIVFLAVLAVAAIGAVTAYAYFTSTGTGTGSATVGDTSAIELSSPTVGPLYPGGADVPVTVSIHNPGQGTEYVGTISGSVATSGTCLGTWFVVDPITFNTQMGPGTTDTASTNVRMLNVGSSQDACKNLPMTINWTSN